MKNLFLIKILMNCLASDTIPLSFIILSKPKVPITLILSLLATFLLFQSSIINKALFSIANATASASPSSTTSFSAAAS